MADTETTDTGTMGEQTTEERSLDVILNLPDDQLTEAEKTRVTEWTAAYQAAQEAHDAEMKAQQEALDELVATHKKLAEDSTAQLQSMQESALDRLNRASKGELV